MNVITKVKNYFMNVYYTEVGDIAIRKMKKHSHDDDDSKFKKWAKIGLTAQKKRLQYLASKYCTKKTEG